MVCLIQHEKFFQLLILMFAIWYDFIAVDFAFVNLVLMLSANMADRFENREFL